MQIKIKKCYQIYSIYTYNRYLKKKLVEKLTKIRLNKEFSLGGKGWPDGIMSLLCCSELNDDKYLKLLSLKEC